MDVSVIIVSYNIKDTLKKCLEAIFEHTKNISFEVIVVDNNSTDGAADYLKEEIKRRKGQLKVIFSKENLGFTKGNNVGIKEARGKYLALLNNDTILVENSLERLFLWMEAKKDVAVVSGQLLNSEQKLVPTGGYFPTLRRVIFWATFIDDIPFFSELIGSFHPQQSPFFKTKNLYEKEFFPDWVTGAFFFVRKEAADQVGLLDESIFMYGEELEWCFRLKQRGWKVAFTPITKAVHLGSSSQGGNPRGWILGEFKGLKYIYGKHFPVWKQIALGTLLDVTAFLRIVFWLVRLKPQMARIYFEALML